MLDRFEEERQRLLIEIDALKKENQELKAQIAPKPANPLMQKMENALLKQIKELEEKLEAANHAAAAGVRYDDFDRYAF